MKKKNELPHSIENEYYVLSTVINDPQCFLEVNAILNPNHFYDEINKIIFENLIEMDIEGIPIDELSLFDFIKKKKLNDKVDIPLINRIVNNMNGAGNVSFYCRRIIEDYLRRQLIIKAEKIKFIAKNESETDVFDLISNAEGLINQISIETEIFDESNEKPLGEHVYDTIIEIKKEREEKTSKRGLTFTGFPTMNKHIGGLIPGDLVGIYGREKSTKSTLAFSMLLDLGLQGIPGSYFSFEMQPQELIKKSLSLKSGIDYNKLRNPKGYNEYSKLTEFELQKLEESAASLKNVPIYIPTETTLNEYQIATKIKRQIKRNGLKIAVIDYLLLMSSAHKFKEKYQEVDHLTKYFKRLAMQLNIVIIVISQSNYDGQRTAEGLGLLRDANYFYFIEPKQDGDRLKFYDSTNNTSYEYKFEANQYLVTLKGSRHSLGNRSFVVQFSNNKYYEIDTVPRFDIHEIAYNTPTRRDIYGDS